MGIEILAGSDEHDILKELYYPILERHAYIHRQYEESGHGNSHYLKDLSAIVCVMKSELSRLDSRKPVNVSQFMLSFAEKELERAEGAFLSYFAEDHPSYSSKS